tara:strand:- start:132 stop:521 length:390 start_codon:yes stop_codon:yes gene_type:complete
MIKKNLGILIFVLFLKTNAFAKEYITYECIGDPSICDDTFIMKFDLKENNNGNIFISKHNLLEHRHINKVNKFDNFQKNSKFYIKLYVINNLSKKFLFIINGKYNDNNLSLINLDIELDGKKLAKMKLK